MAETTKTGNEYSSAFDDKGNIIFSKTGEETQIAFKASEIARLKNTIFTHTHPSSNSFSADDLAFAANAKLKEMRVVSEKYKYSIRPKKTWGDYHALFNGHKKAYDDLYPEYYALVRIKGTMTPAEASWEHLHKTLLAVAKRFNLIYKREVR